jgi:hypothetical protein
LDCSIASLQRKLLELRAEIDSVLAQLAAGEVAPATAAPQADAAPEPTAVAAPEMAEPVLASSTAEIIGEATADDPTADETTDSNDATPVAAIDGIPEAGLFDAAAPAPIADTAETEAHVEPETEAETEANDAIPALLQISSAAEAAAPEAPALEVEQTSPAAMAAGNAPPASADAETPVLTFEPRQRKQKEGSALPTRSGRRVATRVAASILALLVAGTALVAADWAAIGSVQALPWMSQLPSYVPSAAKWSLFGQKQSGAADSPAMDASRSTEDALQQRYREAWPSGA